MIKVVVNILMIIFTMITFISLGLNQGTTGFWNYYFKEKLDLLLSLMMLLGSCLLQLLDYRCEKLSGRWKVHISPIISNKKLKSFIGEGEMILCSRKRMNYSGLMFINWNDQYGQIVMNGLYVIDLHSKRNNVTGKSIMKIREEVNPQFKDKDNARVNFCEYELQFSNTTQKLEGTIRMTNTETSSRFVAEKEI